MKDKSPQTFTAAQAFYEYPGEVHEYLKNTSPDKQAKILLYYLYKKDAPLYRKADDNQSGHVIIIPMEYLKWREPFLLPVLIQLLHIIDSIGDPLVWITL